MKKRTKPVVSVLGMIATLAALLSFSTAPAAASLPPGLPTGEGVTPTVVDGLAECSAGTAYTWTGTAPGTQSPEPGVSITLTKSTGSNPGGNSRYRDFSISGAAMVEAIVFTNFLWPGYIFDESNVYTYDPEDQVTADTKLHAPTLFWNLPFDIDTLRFCYEFTTADVSIEKTVDDAVVSEGDSISYTLVVSNDANSASTATGIVVEDILPEGTSVTDLPENCTDTEGAITCTVDDLAPGDSETIVIGVSIDEGTEGSLLTNRATVAANQDDPDSENNESEALVEVLPILTCEEILQGLETGETFTGIEVQIFGNADLGECSNKNYRAEVREDEGGEQFFLAFDGDGVAATKIVVEKDFATLAFTPLQYAPVDTEPLPSDFVDVPWCATRAFAAGDGDQFLAELGGSLYPTLAGVTDPGTGNPSISCKVAVSESILGKQITVLYGEFSDPWYR